MPGGDPKPFSFRILVVDDEPVILETGALILRDRGYEVHTARDGFEALTALSRSLPDILISDLSMPNMSGFELLSIVRRRFPHVPVIAVSGAYNSTAPSGLIADAFFSKGDYIPENCLPRFSNYWNSHLSEVISSNSIKLRCGCQEVALDTSS